MPRARSLKDEIDDLNARFRKARLNGVTAQATRHGKLVTYYRKTLGYPKVRLNSPPLSPAFMSEWAALVQGVSVPVPSPTVKATGAVPALASSTRSGTFRAMIESYYTSTEFLAKKAQTRHVEKRVLDSCCEEPIAPGNANRFEAMPWPDIRTTAVRILQERKVRKETVTVLDEDSGLPREVEVRRGVEAGNRRVKCLRSVFEYAKLHHGQEINYAAEVGFLKSSNPTEHATWTEEDIAAYEARYPRGSKERLALALLLYGGTRRGDVVRMGPGLLTVLDGRQYLTYVQEKNRDNNPIRAFVPVVPALRAVLDATPMQGLFFLSWGGGDRTTRTVLATCFITGAKRPGFPKAARCTGSGRRASCA